MPRRRTKRFHPPKGDYRIIVTGAPRQDIDVDQLAQVIVKLALKLAADQAVPKIDEATEKRDT